MRRAVRLLALVVASWALIPLPARAQASLPPGFDEETFVAGLDKPTDFAFAPDGRVFLTEKNGRVRVVAADGTLLSAPFATMAVDTQNDRGLMSLVLDPNFAQNRYVYVFFVSTTIPPVPQNSLSRVSRLVRYTANGNVAVPGSETIILDGIPMDADSHAGGSLEFGPDGKLYLAIGDGASYDIANQLALRAQNLDEYPGKLLRLNPDGSAPTDNPFYSTATAIRSKVYQYGLRNPFKSVFRPNTNKMYIMDVGWYDWEEVNVAPPGANFGWPCFEGAGPNALYQSVFPSSCRNATQTAPIYPYAHRPGEGGAAVGGSFYTGTNYPAVYQGKFFFCDYAQKWIKYVEVTAADQFVGISDFAFGFANFRPIDVKTGPDGNLYYLNLGGDLSAATGSLNRIIYVGSGNHPPKPKANAAPTAGYAPLLVNFDATGTTDQDNDPLTYRWLFGDGAEANGFNSSHTYTQNGQYVVTLQVNDTKVTRETKLTITVGSLPPRARILEPPPYRTYEEGEIVLYNGDANDPDDGVIPSGSLVWTVVQHHNEHQHPYHDSIGPSGSFFCEAGHRGSGDTLYYEIVLTATDTSGLQDVKRTFVYLNEPPVANAGPDLQASCVLPDQWVYLDGSGSSDPNSQPLAYRWFQTLGPTVQIVDDTKAVARFKAPRDPAGTVLGFQLNVDDGHKIATDTCQVTVPDLLDDDGDGFPTCNDCAPTNAAQKPPGEVNRLRFGAGSKQSLQWDPLAGAASYDLCRGNLAPGRFRYDHVCLQKDIFATNADDPLVPAAGRGFYYMARAYNNCGRGIYGVARDGAGRPNPPCP